MSSNREQRLENEFLHIFLGLKRLGTNKNHQCIRHVIRDEGNDLKVFENRLLMLGGEWRIHRTVNARCPQKAMKHLMKKLIDHPEMARNIDIEWRTSLLQPECIYGEKLFMLDVDMEDAEPVLLCAEESGGEMVRVVKSPKGWHLIYKPFDTRKVCAIENVSLVRDGYFYVKTVGNLRGEHDEE